MGHLTFRGLLLNLAIQITKMEVFVHFVRKFIPLVFGRKLSHTVI